MTYMHVWGMKSLLQNLESQKMRKRSIFDDQKRLLKLDQHLVKKRNFLQFYHFSSAGKNSHLDACACKNNVDFQKL